MGFKFVNCTQHDICIVNANGYVVTFPPSGYVARVDATTDGLGFINSDDGNQFDLVRNSFGEVYNIPDPQDGVMYIVSAIVLANSDRDDLVRPDTGPTAIRENGLVKHVVRFCQDR